ncbi:hypothetical protein QUC31_017678 [Theobroma cacao]
MAKNQIWIQEQCFCRSSVAAFSCKSSVCLETFCYGFNCLLIAFRCVFLFFNKLLLHPFIEP